MSNLLTYEQAAARLGVSCRSVRRYVAQRKISSVRISGNVRRIRETDLERSIEKLTTKGIL
jgi:excisionase family DNA binding protein